MVKTQEALAMLGEYMEGTWQERKLLQESLHEINELLRLHNVVKEFIAKSDIQDIIEDLELDGYEDMPKLLRELCNIVGYKE